MNKKTIVSLFDGMSCGQIALKPLLGGEDYDWLSSEICKPSINVTQKNFPITIQLGDVRNITLKILNRFSDDIWMVMGGSPCTDFSMAGSRNGMSIGNIEVTSLKQYLQLKKEGIVFDTKSQSYLFWEFVRIVKMTNPKYFFLENVLMKGRNKKWEYVISRELGVEPIYVNSGDFTGQNRERLYWTNIPNINLPNRKLVHCSDIIPNAVGGSGNRGKFKNPDGTWFRQWTTRTDGMVNCLTKSSGCRYVTLTDGTRRPLTIEECEQFQGVPIGYTDVVGVTKKDRHDMLGNGWTIDVIKHFFSFIPELEKTEHLFWTSKIN